MAVRKGANSHLYYDTRIFFVYSSAQVLHRTFGTEFYFETTQNSSSTPKERAINYKKSRDLDCIPLRMPSSLMNLRVWFINFPHATLIKTEEELPKDKELQIVQADIFSDNLHFSAKGHMAMAKILEPYLLPLLKE